jgi:hypothetical protein
MLVTPIAGTSAARCAVNFRWIESSCKILVLRLAEQVATRKGYRRALGRSMRPAICPHRVLRAPDRAAQR